MTVSPDGRNVYVATGFDRRIEGPGAQDGGFDASGVAVFARNATSGGLRQLAGRAACVSERPTASACADGRALEGALAVRVSRDGTNAYVAASASNALAVFARDAATGGLKQLAGKAGCVSETGTVGACRDGIGLSGRFRGRALAGRPLRVRAGLLLERGGGLRAHRAREAQRPVMAAEPDHELARTRAVHLEAILRAADRRDELMRIVGDAPDAAVAHGRVQELLGVAADQATAVLDLRLVRFNRGDLAAVRTGLDRLRSLLGAD